MHITIVTVGSRGDIQPKIALGAGLKAAGHSVRIATHQGFEEWATRYGLDFAPIEGDPRQTVESKLGQEWLATGANTFAFAKKMAELMRPMMAKATSDLLEACKGSDLVLYSMLGWLGVHSVLEKLGIPGYPVYLQPASPTRHFPSMGALTNARLGGFHNLLTHWGGEFVFWQMFRKCINEARAKVLRLPAMPFRAPFAKMRREGLPVFYGYSPTVLPKPPDWTDNVHVTGYWFLDGSTDWTPPEALVEFIESGPPPVCIGFGSMYSTEAEELTRTVVTALERSGQRAILLSGWGGLFHGDLPDSVFPIVSAPHDWLFPRMAAVVHHGGAGTTAAGLRAGIPSIVVPFFADQPFWGRRVHALGVGPKPIPVKRLNAERLGEAITIAVSDTRMMERAAAVGESIRAEDGIGKVVEVLGEYPTPTR